LGKGNETVPEIQKLTLLSEVGVVILWLDKIFHRILTSKKVTPRLR
jgi:hypothetical protein